MNKSGEKHKVIHLNEEQLRDIIKEVLLRLYEIDEDYLYKDVFVEMKNIETACFLYEKIMQFSLYILLIFLYFLAAAFFKGKKVKK